MDGLFIGMALVWSGWMLSESLFKIAVAMSEIAEALKNLKKTDEE
jgi:hypothetical protein